MSTTKIKIKTETPDRHSARLGTSALTAAVLLLLAACAGPELLQGENIEGIADRLLSLADSSDSKYSVSVIETEENALDCASI